MQQLEFPALHPSKPELTSDCTAEEVAAVVLDARSRIGTLVAVNAQIGSFVATEESENAILDAAGLGLEWLSEDDPRFAGRDAPRPPRPGEAALMSDRQWVQDILESADDSVVAFGLGWTIDITQTLVALALRGCPLVWRRSTGSGSKTAGPGSCPPRTRPALSTTTAPPRNGPRTSSSSPAGRKAACSRSRRYPDLVFVNGKRQRVWANGKQVHGSSMERDATPGWGPCSLSPAPSPSHGGGSQSIADRIGIPLDEVRAAMPALGTHVFFTPIGWEAADGAPCATGRWRPTGFTAESVPAGAATPPSTSKPTSSLRWVE